MTVDLGTARPAGVTAARVEPVRKLIRWRLTVAAVGAAVVALPLLRPSGPGNTGIVDVALLGAMFATAFWASTRAHRVSLPYAWPVGLLVLAGALAATFSSSGGGHSFLALLQDVFVFGWAAAVTTLGRDSRLLDLFCRVWAYSVTAWAAALIIGELAGITWLTGINSADGIRASLTFGDPNLAADYFLCGLFVLRACQRPRHRGWRFLCCAVVITAMVLTLSNGGMLALAVATMVGALFALAGRRGVASALTVGLIAVAGAAMIIGTVDIHGWVVRVEQSDALVRDSLGRSAESGGSRTTLAREGIALWLRGDTVLGYGPANTETTLRADQASYVKEAHDDYLATLLERGIIGAVALIVLIIAVGVRARRVSLARALSPEYRAIVPRPELIAAAVVAVAVSAAFYEVLHFRHVWALLGLLAALEQSGQPARRGARGAPAEHRGLASQPRDGECA